MGTEKLLARALGPGCAGLPLVSAKCHQAEKEGKTSRKLLELVFYDPRGGAFVGNPIQT